MLTRHLHSGALISVIQSVAIFRSYELYGYDFQAAIIAPNRPFQSANEVH